MNSIEFESMEIIIEVLDYNDILANNLIGRSSIGCATLYRSPNHEMFSKWLMVTHPDEGLKSQGHILVSAYIICENDRPPVHDVNDLREAAKEEEDEDDDDENLPKEALL